jgi:hypothetical protein
LSAPPPHAPRISENIIIRVMIIISGFFIMSVWF